MRNDGIDNKDEDENDWGKQASNARESAQYSMEESFSHMPIICKVIEVWNSLDYFAVPGP